jgi:pimeloyl-ACP methyl ester carboxylesterase
MALETEITEESTSRTVQALGTTIHYHDVGSGPPAVFLHFWGPGSTAWVAWHKVLPLLAPHFRCIAVDSPNYAKTGPLYLDESLYFMQADAAAAVMDSLGIERAFIVGASQGGQSALTFASKYPDRVEKLVFGGNHLGSVQGDYLLGNPNEEGIRVAYPALANPTPENMRPYLELCVVDKSLITDELIDYLIKQHTGRPDIAEAREKMSYGPRHDLTPDMMNIAAPTLIIWGRNDRTCGVEIGLKSMNLIPNSRITILRDTGHWAPFEKPREYADHLISFLKGDWERRD